MSSKQNSTIGAKPAVQPNIEAWIGGAATESMAESAPGSVSGSVGKVAGATRKASQPAKQPADKPASQLNSQPESQSAEGEAMAMLSARIPAPLMKQLRIRAATEDRQIQDIIAELLRGYLGKV
jgi:hypothetical protein